MHAQKACTNTRKHDSHKEMQSTCTKSHAPTLSLREDFFLLSFSSSFLLFFPSLLCESHQNISILHFKRTDIAGKKVEHFCITLCAYSAIAKLRMRCDTMTSAQWASSTTYVPIYATQHLPCLPSSICSAQANAHKHPIEANASSNTSGCGEADNLVIDTWLLAICSK
jgi:hypothetical protein